MIRITLAYTNHRPEALPYAKEIMRSHEAVLLEEASDPAFNRMLHRRQAVEDYVALLDTEYPGFSRLSCIMFQELHDQGMVFKQVEPYIDRLIEIHELFAKGKSPANVLKIKRLKQVYLAEKAATGTLIDFYEAVAKQPIPIVLAALKAFAKADAQRFRLRDDLRSAALVEEVRGYSSCYIEAGTMHFWLETLLKKRLDGRHRMEVRYPMAPAVKAVTGRDYLLGPGDELTLQLIYHPYARSQRIDLLAARSLMFNKILTKTEIGGSDDELPHTRDEWRALQLVNQLRMDDCERLFPQIRFAGTDEANSIVKTFLLKRGDV